MKLLLTPLATVLALGLALPGCSLPDFEDFGDSGAGTAGDDERGDDDDDDDGIKKPGGGDDDDDDDDNEGDDDDDDDDNEGDDDDDDDNEGDDDDDSVDETGDGGPIGDDACAAYCDVELACDEYYESTAECMAACGNATADAGQCSYEFDNMNWCLSELDCEEFMIFWQSLAALSEGVEVPPFACAEEFLEYAVCVSDEGDGGDA